MIARVNSKAFGRADEEGLNRGGGEGPGADEASEGQIWLTSVDVAARWGLCVGTIRAYADSGRLPVHRLPGKFSHRRFALSDCERVLGCPKLGKEEISVGGGIRPIAIYGRVSGNKQSVGFKTGAGESDLSRQVERLTSYAKETYGVAPVVYTDTGSGLSFTRKGLEGLMKSMLAGELDGGIVICTHKDRLARFGVELIGMVAKSRGIEIVFSEKEEVRSEDETAELAQDVIAVLTHFSARIHGRRASQTLKAPLTPETVTEALRMKGEGMLPCQIAKILRGKNHRNGKGRLVNEYSILSLFENVGDSLDGLLGEEKPTNSFEEWAGSNLVKDEEARGHVHSIHAAYSAWATSEGKTPLSNIAVQRFLRDNYGFGLYKCKKVYCVRMKGGAQ